MTRGSKLRQGHASDTLVVGSMDPRLSHAPVRRVSDWSPHKQCGGEQLRRFNESVAGAPHAVCGGTAAKETVERAERRVSDQSPRRNVGGAS